MDLVAQLVEATAGQQKALDQLMANTAEPSMCMGCEAPFYFLDEHGFVAHEDKYCPDCAGEHKGQPGIAVSVQTAKALRARRSAQMRVASSLAEITKRDHSEVMAAIEHLDRTDQFVSVMGELEAVCDGWEERWMTAVLICSLGLERAALVDETAKRLAHHRDPDHVVRVVAWATTEKLEAAGLEVHESHLNERGRVVIYDGPMGTEAIRLIRSAEIRLGRDLRLVFHYADGRELKARGDRKPIEPPEGSLLASLRKSTLLTNPMEPSS